MDFDGDERDGTVLLTIEILSVLTSLLFIGSHMLLLFFILANHFCSLPDNISVKLLHRLCRLSYVTVCSLTKPQVLSFPKPNQVLLETKPNQVLSEPKPNKVLSKP